MPSEYAFQCEFISTLKYVLGLVYTRLQYRVLPEVKSPGNRHRRLDILLCDGTQPQFGFELVVAANQSSFDDHMERADDYCVNHRCSGMYLVNLTNDYNLTNYYGPEFLQGVTPVHIFFGGGRQGEVEIRYRNNTVSVTIEGGRWSILFDSM